jgi:hypothetical protein
LAGARKVVKRGKLFAEKPSPRLDNVQVASRVIVSRSKRGTDRADPH